MDICSFLCRVDVQFFPDFCKLWVQLMSEGCGVSESQPRKVVVQTLVGSVVPWRVTKDADGIEGMSESGSGRTLNPTKVPGLMGILVG